VTPALITYVMVHYGWRSSFWMSAIIGLIAGTVWYFVARDTPEKHALVSASDWHISRLGDGQVCK